MPDITKARHKFGFDQIDLEVGGLIHRYFLDGLAAAENGDMDPTARAKCYSWLEKLEGVLVQSGYMKRYEIELRHKEKEQNRVHIITDPYNIQ